MTALKRLLAPLLMALTLAPLLGQAAAPASFLPQRDLGKFLAENFDLASVRSSFGPRRKPEQRTFADFGMQPTRAADDVLEYDGDTWFYQLRVLRRADINRDGIEDLEVCFTDRSKSGAYDVRKTLLVSRYSDETYAVALAYDVDGCDAPKKSKAKSK